MSIVTKGLGSPSLITKGYGWHRVKEAIKEVVSRLIPRRRKKVLMKIRVTGDLISPFEQTITCEGEKDFTPLWIVLEDEEEE